MFVLPFCPSVSILYTTITTWFNSWKSMMTIDPMIIRMINSMVISPWLLGWKHFITILALHLFSTFRLFRHFFHWILLQLSLICVLYWLNFVFYIDLWGRLYLRFVLSVHKPLRDPTGPGILRLITEYKRKQMLLKDQ